MILLNIENTSALHKKSTQNNANKKKKMAIIYSYPTLTPQLGDKVLGSNITDASGTPVSGNPTVQYAFTDIKALVDQQFIQQFTSSSNDSLSAGIPASQGPVATNTAHPIIFGQADTSSTSVTIDAAGKVVFLKTGTYYITQEYSLGVSAAPNTLQTMFRIYDGANQVGPTHLEKWKYADTADRKRVVIHTMVNITLVNSAPIEYIFQMIRDANGANDGKLYQQTNNNGWTTTPNAQITISKLI